MSLWTDATIHINLSSICTESDFLHCYRRFSRAFKGSEGGLKITFLTEEKMNRDFSDLNVTNFKLLTGVVLQGNLRSVSEDSKQLLNAVHDLYMFLHDLGYAKSCSAKIEPQFASDIFNLEAKDDFIRMYNIETGYDEKIRIKDDTPSKYFEHLNRFRYVQQSISGNI